MFISNPRWRPTAPGMAVLLCASLFAVSACGPPTPFGGRATPPDLSFPTMAFDAARQQIVLFGGYSPQGGELNDTWTWDGRNWTRQHPAKSPLSRSGAAMAYDAGRRQAVLFGGERDASSSYMGDTWTWDGRNWTRR